MRGLAAPPHRPSPGGSATPPRLGVCPPPARLRAAPWSCRLPLKGGVMSISWERGRPARILSLPALPPPPVPPVKPAEVAVPDSLPQNAPSRPPSRAFLPRGSPRGSVRGCSWRGLGGAVRCGRVLLNRRLRGCGQRGVHTNPGRYVFSVIVNRAPCRRQPTRRLPVPLEVTHGAPCLPPSGSTAGSALSPTPPQGGSDLEACTKLLARFLGMM